MKPADSSTKAIIRFSDYRSCPSFASGPARGNPLIAWLAGPALLVAFAGGACGAEAVEKASVPQPSAEWQTKDGIDYLALVKAYANTLIEKGRDVYGPEATPLFASALDRRSFQISDSPVKGAPKSDPGVQAPEPARSFPGIQGIRGGDRITSGANPMTDENLYQVLYALSQTGGDPKYATEADKALTYFFEHCQSPVTGLLAWGEHMGWDFNLESPISNTHEFFRPWILWEACYRLTPEAGLKFAHGLWDHQIGNKKDGNFSRHAAWSKHGTQPNHDFPRHAGFYIATWARAYKQTQDPVFLKAIETLVARYDKKRSPESGGIPSDDSARGRLIMWPISNLSLAIDLTAAAQDLPPDLRPSLTALAGSIDQTFLKINHRPENPERFFVTFADVRTLEPGLKIAPDLSEDAIKWIKKKGDPHARLWATGYGEYTSAQVADICYLRYQQLPPGEAKEAYKKLVLETADRYLQADVNFKASVYPGSMGDVVWNLLDAFELTKDNKYLNRADELAKIAVETFCKEGCALPTASSKNDHYETVTRGDTLMMALLRLWNVQQSQPAELTLVYSDR